MKVNKGAIKKRIVLESLGKMVSLVKSLRPSANGCNNPTNPITFGPFRRWIIPIILRSAIVKYATEINKGMIIDKDFSKRILRRKINLIIS